MNFFDRGIKSLRAGGAKGFFKNFRDYAASQVGLLYESVILTIGTGRMIESFESQSSKQSGIDSLVGFSFNFSYMGVSVRAVQERSEITELLELLKGRKLSSLMEIGTDRGGTLFLFCRIAVPNARIISMNLPWSSLNAYCMRYRSILYEKFALPDQKLSLLSLNSHEPASLEEAKDLLHNQKLDFLFIDGDHSYEGVKKDFEMYAPLVKNGGVIAFHDIAEHLGQKDNPVRDYWQSIKKTHEHKELEHSNGKGYGIGIIYWKGEIG